MCVCVFFSLIFSYVHSQSHTIARFLARRHNLAGSDEWQAAKIDAFVDLIGDLLNGMYVYTNLIRVKLV